MYANRDGFGQLFKCPSSGSRDAADRVVQAEAGTAVSYDRPLWSQSAAQAELLRMEADLEAARG